MKFYSYLEKDNIVIAFTGAIPELSEKDISSIVKLCLESSVTAVLFDWSKVTYFDSSGLENLLAIYKNIRRFSKKKIAICISDTYLVTVYVTLKFDKIVPLFDDKEKAVEYLASQKTAMQSVE
jgi:anti-anti-sigma factor